MQIIDTLIRMRGNRRGLVQTPEQLKFSLQAIEDAMKTMDLIEESNGTTIHDRYNTIWKKYLLYTYCAKLFIKNG